MSNYEDQTPNGAVNDNAYVNRRGDNGPVDVVKDEATIEDPVSAQDADSGQQLEQDDKDAIDKSNIIKSRLRGNEPKPGAMAEPVDGEKEFTERD